MESTQKSALVKKVESAIDSIRPYLEQDGGDITVEDVTDDFVVHVRLHGACSSCPYRQE